MWLAEIADEHALPPQIKSIESRIEQIPRKRTIYIERLDYLISKNGFKETLSFVHYLRELAYLKDLIVLLSIDPSTVRERELRLLEKEGKKVESIHKAEMSEILFNLMEFIYEQNLRGVRPSYGTIHKNLRMSKPTVRGKLRTLISAGYVKEEQKGASKIVELTELGRSRILE